MFKKVGHTILRLHDCMSHSDVSVLDAFLCYSNVQYIKSSFSLTEKQSFRVSKWQETSFIWNFGFSPNPAQDLNMEFPMTQMFLYILLWKHKSLVPPEWNGLPGL